MRGRKPKPTKLKLVAGNPGKRKINTKEPKPMNVAPRQPAEMNADEKKVWKYITEELGHMGILASSDQGVIAAYCHWAALSIKAKRLLNKLGESGKDPEIITTKSGNIIQNPWLGIANRANHEIVKVAAQLGLDPTARTRLEVEKETDAGPDWAAVAK